MSTRLFAILFAALFLIGALPIFLQPSGPASAGITAGFLAPIESVYHGLGLIAIGLVAALTEGEMTLVLPLATLLMLSIGAMMHIQNMEPGTITDFILGAIFLFALTISLLRRRSRLVYVLPIAAWAYAGGRRLMAGAPLIAMPLFFLIGMLVSNALILAIGMALGMTLSDVAHRLAEKLKHSPAFATFLSFF